MKPKQLRIPRPVHHKASGRDVVFLRKPDGKRKMVYLGPHASAEATRNYRAVLAAYLAGSPLPVGPKVKRDASAWPSVAQLVAAFLLHCDRYYVDENDQRSKSVVNFINAMKPFVRLLRDIQTDELTIGHLCSVRQLLIDEGKCNRQTINGKLQLIRQCIRWGVEQRMVPGTVWHEISAMKGVPMGRAGVRERKEVEAVPWRWVEAILPHLTEPLAAAVQLQWWSAARPSEILQLTRESIEFAKGTWLFRPHQHKGRWKGKQRVIMLGPEAQRILGPMLKLEPEAAILSPRDAMSQIRERKAAARKSKEQPSQQNRRTRNASKGPSVGEFYDVNSYRKAIHRACDAADVPRWSPHRLRHAAGTRIYLAEGIEASRVALGHRDDRVTRRYAIAADSELAAAVMGRLG